jgi:flagellar protein FlaJ
MPKVSKKKFRKIIFISVSTGGMIALYSVIAFYFNLPLILPPDISAILGFVIAIFPPGIAHLFNVMWRRAIDRNVPKLLRQIAEAGRIGVSIPKALVIASKYDLGPLTPELQKAVARLSWGYPFDKVINDLVEEIDTPTVRRAFKLILEASRSGGDVEEMLMTLQRHISGIQLTLRERMMMMRPYISYGYIAFFVFLAIEVILLKSFFLPILAIRGEAAALGSMFRMSITADQIKTYFYHISLIEALISGLVSGKMGEGTIFAGLKHVAILLVSTVITYYLFIFR